MALELDDEAADLFCSIIASNVDEAARISNVLIDSEKRQTRFFAKAFLDLYEALERIPDFVRAVAIERLLEANYVRADAAQRLIVGEGDA
jgi:hypothetical protein